MTTIDAPAWPGNCGRSRALSEVTLIVLHSTESETAKSAVRWFKSPQAKVSAHYVVDTDGTVYKCVPTSKIAYHAGTSTGPNGEGCNLYSVGIEQAHIDSPHNPWPPELVSSTTELVKTLKAAIPSIVWIATHAEVATPEGRKTDPQGFPVEQVAQAAGLKVWRRQ